MVNEVWQLNKGVEGSFRRETPQTPWVMRYAVGDILSATFILQGHYCVRSSPRSANVKTACMHHIEQ
jgi:hypothetical protein